jgi:hypothetical protein
MKKTFTALSLALLLTGVESLDARPALAATSGPENDAVATSATKTSVGQSKKKSRKKKRVVRRRRASRKK